MQGEIFSGSSQSTALTWKDVLAEQKDKKYFKDVISFVEQERSLGKTIYPPKEEVFFALKATPLESVKVVIIGQDPYFGPNQAHGLCFSVKPGVPFPPSLRNILTELKADLGCSSPQSGCLSKWAKQGVLLLNAVLTVEAGNPGSHANKGWEVFTDAIIEKCSSCLTGVVFLLWGAYAQKKGKVIDLSKHNILTAPHPSPLSATRGFFGCRHFSKTNEILTMLNKQPIDWALN